MSFCTKVSKNNSHARLPIRIDNTDDAETFQTITLALNLSFVIIVKKAKINISVTLLPLCDTLCKN